jgi:hypothetical protein
MPCADYVDNVGTGGRASSSPQRAREGLVLTTTVGTQPAVGPQERPKAPGIVVLVLTTALAALVAVIGITSRAAPPPTVAQFAPQAVQQIKQAPDQQSSGFGEGKGVDGAGGGEGGGSGGATTTSTQLAADAPESEVPVTRRCVGNPPRQIEDPQSPPCVPFFQGDNGGATSKGVTGETIRIAVPGGSGPTFSYDAILPLQNFFNRRFEFYGRKIELFNPGVANSDVPEVERTDAAKVDSQVAFASLGYSYNLYYAEELAKRKVISVTQESYYTEKQLHDLSPYVWQYPMSIDGQFDTMGAWICKRLGIRPATHAGDPTLRDDPRVYGLVGFDFFPERPVDFGPVKRRLEGCGAKVKQEAVSHGSGSAVSPSDAENLAIQMRQNGVTTVICLCNNFQAAVLMKGATNQAYLPEWIGGTYIFGDEDYTLHVNQEQLQLDHYFGLTHQPREGRVENQPATWAVKEGSGRPDGPQTAGAQRDRRYAYHELLLLASGIQMAGPNLTPETFGQALQKTTFPNPPDPTFQGVVGFKGDHSMTDDVAEFFWSSQGLSPYVGSPGGAVCYVDHGARRTANSFAATEPSFGLPCDSRDT